MSLYQYLCNNTKTSDVTEIIAMLEFTPDQLRGLNNLPQQFPDFSKAEDFKPTTLFSVNDQPFLMAEATITVWVICRFDGQKYSPGPEYYYSPQAALSAIAEEVEAVAE